MKLDPKALLNGVKEKTKDAVHAAATFGLNKDPRKNATPVNNAMSQAEGPKEQSNAQQGSKMKTPFNMEPKPPGSDAA